MSSSWPFITIINFVIFFKDTHPFFFKIGMLQTKINALSKSLAQNNTNSGGGERPWEITSVTDQFPTKMIILYFGIKKLWFLYPIPDNSAWKLYPSEQLKALQHSIPVYQKPLPLTPPKQVMRLLFKIASKRILLNSYFAHISNELSMDIKWLWWGHIVNPFSPNIHIQILQTGLYIFP